MTRGKWLKPKEKKLIKQMSAKKLNIAQIAKALGRSSGAICQYLSRQKGFSPNRVGRPREISEEDCQKILHLSKTTNLSARKIREELGLTCCRGSINAIIRKHDVRNTEKLRFKNEIQKENRRPRTPRTRQVIEDTDCVKNAKAFPLRAIQNDLSQSSDDVTNFDSDSESQTSKVEDQLKRSLFKAGPAPEQENQVPDLHYLLLENWVLNKAGRRIRKSSQCFMNTICNMLFCCKEIRSLLLNHHSQNILTKIFRKETNSSREWRATLPPRFHTGHQDISDVFADLVKNLPQQSLQFKCTTQRTCSKCGVHEERSEVEVAGQLILQEKTRFSTELPIQYGPLETHSVCVCGGRLLEKRVRTSPGVYHLMMVDAPDRTSIDIHPDSLVAMLGAEWKIIAFAQYFHLSRDGTKGHYCSWIRCGEEVWICVNDDRLVERRRRVVFAKYCIKIMVFEKVQ